MMRKTIVSLVLLVSGMLQAQVPGKFSTLSVGSPSTAFAVDASGNITTPITSRFTGNYTSSVGVNHLQVLEGGIDPSTEFNRTNGVFNETSSIYGGLVIPPTSTTVQSAGVMGVAKNFSGLPGGVTNGVGGFFAGICMVNSSSCWGVNSLVQDAPGTFNSLLWGIEDDVNIYSSTTHGYGLDIIGRWAAQPTIFFPAIMVHKPLNFPGDTTGDYRWTAGLEFETGSIFGEGRGVTLNPMKQAVSQRSQLIRWNAINSAGITHAYSSYEDPFGNLLFFPEGGGPTGGGGVYDSFNVDGSVSANLAGTASATTARLLEPSVATGNFVAQVIGASETLNNAAFIQFANNGGTGSQTNLVAIGLYGANKNLSVDGAGNIAFPGIITQGVGIQHKRGSVGCSTPATAGALCTGPAQTFTVPFFDTNYTIACTLSSTNGTAIMQGIVKTRIDFSITITALNALATTANYDCIAMYGTD